MVIDKKATQEEAVRECLGFNNSSSLLTIHSNEEQDFANNMLIKYNKTSSYAWIGLKYKNERYRAEQWMDGSDDNYTNWSEDAVKDGRNECVKMSLDETRIGQWIDDSCERKALVVCQKKQVITIEMVNKVNDNMTDTMNNLGLLVQSQAKELIALQGEVKQYKNELSGIQLIQESFKKQEQILKQQDEQLEAMKTTMQDDRGIVQSLNETITQQKSLMSNQEKVILTLTDNLHAKLKEISTIKKEPIESVPIGFIYTQLPGPRTTEQSMAQAYLVRRH